MATKRMIYFCGSMRAGRQDVDLYATLVEKLGKYGEVRGGGVKLTSLI